MKYIVNNASLKHPLNEQLEFYKKNKMTCLEISTRLTKAQQKIITDYVDAGYIANLQSFILENVDFTEMLSLIKTIITKCQPSSIYVKNVIISLSNAQNLQEMLNNNLRLQILRLENNGLNYQSFQMIICKQEHIEYLSSIGNCLGAQGLENMTALFSHNFAYKKIISFQIIDKSISNAQIASVANSLTNLNEKFSFLLCNDLVYTREDSKLVLYTKPSTSLGYAINRVLDSVKIYEHISDSDEQKRQICFSLIKNIQKYKKNDILFFLINDLDRLVKFQHIYHSIFQDIQKFMPLKPPKIIDDQPRKQDDIEHKKSNKRKLLNEESFSVKPKKISFTEKIEEASNYPKEKADRVRERMSIARLMS